MPRSSSVSNLTAAMLYVLTLLLSAGPSAADEGISKRVTRLEKQVAALTSQVAALRVEMSHLEPMTFQVSCGRGERIQAALTLAGDRSAKVTINIAGSCPEDVSVSRSNTILRAVAPGDGFRALSLDGAKGVRLEGLTLTRLDADLGASFTADGLSVSDSPGIAVYITGGSTGDLWSPTLRQCGGGTCVEVNGGGSLTINQGLIEGSGTGWGVVTHGSSISLNGTVIRGHSRGIWVVGGVVRMVGGAVEQNTSEGIVTNGGYLHAEGTAFRDNFWMGIAVMGGMVWIQDGEVNSNGTGVFSAGGVVHLTNTLVRGNRFAGITLESGSSLLIGGTTVAENQGDGIWLGDVSVAIGTADLTGNQGWGLRCELAPAVAQYRGTFKSNNNAAGDISCQQP